jgi:hypothetical protein
MMPRPPRRIVFTGDFLRPGVAAERPTQHHNIRWLRNLVSTPLQMATDLPQEVVSWGAANVNDGRLTSADVAAIYHRFGLVRNLSSWAALFDAERLPSSVENLLRPLFQDSLVVGFEIPPYLEHFLNREGIPFIGTTIHPVRFLDDILLAFRSNCPSVRAALSPCQVSDAFIRTMAGVQKASAARYFNEEVRPGSALMLMQTWYDQSQILDGRFVDATRYLDEIIAFARNHTEFLVKEHPLGANPATIILQARVPNLRLVTGNVYGYLSIPEVSSVLTISSSVGVEAPYFGVRTQFLLRPSIRMHNPAEPEDTGYMAMQDAFLSADFWRNTLRGLMPVTAPDGVIVPFKPNRLRISMRSFWNFNEIDTDVTSAMGHQKQAAS